MAKEFFFHILGLMFEVLSSTVLWKAFQHLRMSNLEVPCDETFAAELSSTKENDEH